jgi:hypothetical protein
MEDVVAVRVDLVTGESRYFMTWGRIQDVVDPEPLEALVMRHASGYDSAENQRGRSCASHSASRTSAASNCVVWLWRRSWKRMPGSPLATPCWRTSSVQRRESRSGWMGEPSTSQKTRSRSRHPGPRASRRRHARLGAHRDPHRSRQGRDLPPRGGVPSAGSRWSGPSCRFGHQAHRSNDRCPKRHFRRASTPR